MIRKVCPGGCGRAIERKAKRCPECAAGLAVVERRQEKTRHRRQPYRSAYGSAAYKRARARAFKRDGGICRALIGNRICGLQAVETHHIVPLSQGGAASDENNLVSVCFKHNPRGGSKS